MNEKAKPEVEIKDTTMEDIEAALHAVVGETVKLLESLGKVMVRSAQDISKLMVIKVEDSMREQLDTLVDAGLADNRRAAATTMLEEGIKAKNADFERIRKTKVEIEQLRKQMQSLIPGRT